MGFKERVLGMPIVYQLFQQIVGKFGYSRLHLYSHYLPYTPGMKVLDLGCGPGTACHFFNPSDYFGLDISTSYIQHARAANPRYRFVEADYLSVNVLELSQFRHIDLIFAMGLLHHMDDAMVTNFLAKSFSLLPSGGRMICFDGCVHEGQSLASKKIVLSDRGQYIRMPCDLEKIAEEQGFHVTTTIEKSVYAIPYSLLVMSLFKG